MNNPLISVVMPAFNAQKFAARAIKSILNQTYTNFEFIIINDGSTDKTKTIIQSFADDRIILLDKKQNGGLVAALNDGIAAAKGEYIARMDADDESLPERFKLQVNFMQKNKDIDVLGTAMMIFRRHTKKIKKFPKTHQQCLQQLFNNTCFAHPAVMMKKSALISIKYHPQYQHAEDYKLWIDLLKNGAKFANLQTPLLNYYWHDDNISVKKKSSQNQCAQVIQQEYLRHYLQDKPYDKRFEWFLSKEQKRLSLPELNDFYQHLRGKNHFPQVVISNIFKAAIRARIDFIYYHFNRPIIPILLFYYFGYKFKKIAHIN